LIPHHLDQDPKYREQEVVQLIELRDVTGSGHVLEIWKENGMKRLAKAGKVVEQWSMDYYARLQKVDGLWNKWQRMNGSRQGFKSRVEYREHELWELDEYTAASGDGFHAIDGKYNKLLGLG